MKMPFGPEWLQHFNMNVPNFVASNMPGFESFATAMMEQTTKIKGVPSIRELRDICVESGVKLVACQMTVDLVQLPQGGVHAGNCGMDWCNQLSGGGKGCRCLPVCLT